MPDESDQSGYELQPRSKLLMLDQRFIEPSQLLMYLGDVCPICGFREFALSSGALAIIVDI